MPAEKRGFCLRIADSSVLPERGRPEMKWSHSGGLTDCGLAGMRVDSPWMAKR
jgi:hypothetical protein